MERLEEAIDLLTRIVEGKGGTCHGLMPHTAEQWLGAVMPRANGDAEAIQ